MTSDSRTGSNEFVSGSGWRSYSGLIAHAVAVVAQLPLALVWFREIWYHQNHVVLLPAIALTIAFAVIRWPRGGSRMESSSATGSILLLAGLLAGLTGAVFSIPWFSAVSVLILVASALCRTVDLTEQKNLLPCAYPLAVCGVLPAGFDFRLDGWLQTRGLDFGSKLLDLLGVVNDCDGLTLKNETGDVFSVQDILSAVPSLHVLVLVACGIAAWQRMPGFQTLLLALSAFFWRTFMVAAMLFMVLFANKHLKTDFKSANLGVLYTMMFLFSAGMLFCSLQFVKFLTAAVEDYDEGSGIGRRVLRFWNVFVAGVRPANRSRRSRSAMNGGSSMFLLVAAGILALGGLIRIPQAMGALFSADPVFTKFSREDFPESLGAWTLYEHAQTRGAPGGIRQREISLWDYSNPGSSHLQLFIEESFTGWYSLPRELELFGWRVTNQSVRNAEDGKGAPCLEVELNRASGENIYLLFSMFDSGGNPLQPRKAGSPAAEVLGWFAEHRGKVQLPQAMLVRCQFTSFKTIEDEMKQKVFGEFLSIQAIVGAKRTETRPALPAAE